MAEDNDRLRRLRLETTMVEYCVSAGWIAPEVPGYSDADLARACLVRDLREAMGVNDEGVSVALDLLDQIHGLRRVGDVMHGLPEPARQEVLVILRELDEA